ncbi:MAG: TolC family protein [Gemmatimonadales bacterium]|nr:MAG: TolC family protein [Gemmatimonadales bacterium]
MNWSMGRLPLVLSCLSLTPALLPAQQTLQLDQAIQTALLHNPSMTSAEASASAAAASRWADWGAFLPTVTANGSVSKTDFSTITFLNPDGTTTVLDEALDDTNKNNSAGLNFGLRLSADQFANLGAGSARQDAADFRLAATSSEVVRQVKVAYFDALKRQALVGVAERQTEARSQDYEVTRGRYQIAAATRSDLLGAEIDLRNAELRILDARDAFVSAVRQLRASLGQDVSGILPGDLILEELEGIPDAFDLEADRLVASAFANNPGLRALAADERAASASVLSARASYLPTLNFGLNLGRGRQVADDESLFSFSPANTNRNVSISASWALFSGFQRKQRNAETSSQLTQVRASITAQEFQIEREVRDLVDGLRRRAHRLQLMESNTELSSERLDLARESYRRGSITYFNLQQAIESLDQSQQDVLDERY